MSSKVLNNLVIAVIVNNAFARAEQAKGSVRHAEAQRIAMCHVILKSLALWTGLNWIELDWTNSN